MDQQSEFLGTEEQPVIPPNSDEKTLAILSHVLTFVAPILAPLIIYLIKKDDSTFVAAHAKESLNFQITLVLIIIVLMISVIGWFLLWLPGIIALVLVIVATIKASDGKLYRYPFTLRLIK
ncbi:MAG: DUF4870 domain-containing protein [Terrimonas sp.]|uniref:DUF4870 domain-containing protein n=1 Tax=Terrimonas sp. TaxID=1914338 RepID=UPI000929274C|nr:DUF4870 domain-containing protein [Terrimonas sp.]MBN8785876.1 DUF4870 domain-containing protein [Terrimonas sp.]OJY95372.1 MAG: hypothetical protein BGP13_13865 [Sphingobacteriales bacterium 40-81]PVD49698.1 DUF4870 domain-containing protein [Terrimonas sp.]